MQNQHRELGLTSIAFGAYINEEGKLAVDS